MKKVIEPVYIPVDPRDLSIVEITEKLNELIKLVGNNLPDEYLVCECGCDEFFDLTDEDNKSTAQFKCKKCEKVTGVYADRLVPYKRNSTRRVGLYKNPYSWG